MSEPETVATLVRPVGAGVLHWSIHDERIGFRSDAYALVSGPGSVLIDPLPLSPAALESIGPVVGICMTGGFHQRSAWSLRKRLGVPVWAPRGSAGLIEPSDREFVDGDVLPGGLVAIEMKGPTNPHFVLMKDGPSGLVAFCADLLVEDGHGRYRVASEEHHDDIDATRRSVEALHSRGPALYCPAHGEPFRDPVLASPGPRCR